jgi:ATP-binding cassette, subfamily B, bacterial PglK
MYKKIFNLFDKDEKKTLYKIMLIAIIMALFETIGVASIMPFMSLLSNPELVTNEQGYYKYFFELLNFETIRSFQIFLGCVVLLLIVATNIFAIYSLWVVQMFTANQNKVFSTKLLKNYLHKPYSFYFDNNTSELGKNILSESMVLTEGVILPVIQLITKMLVTLSILILLFYINPVLLMIMGGSLISGYYIVYLFTNTKFEEYGQKKLDLNTKKFKVADESLSGVKVIKFLQKEIFFLNKFENISKEYADITANYQILKLLPKHFMEILAFGGIMAITLYMLTNEFNAKEIVPVLSIYALAGYRLMPALQQIYASIVTIKYNQAAAGVVQRDLQSIVPVSISSKHHTQRINFNKSIQIKNLDYGYQKKSLIFNNLNIDIVKNSFIAFIGATGSGKSTLIDIIMGLNLPNKGGVYIDDQLVTKNNIAEWRRKIAYVPQEIFLLDDSILANIAFGEKIENISKARAINAAKAAKIHSFIKNEMKCGYETRIGDRGIQLSGGQKQRIGIARALYREPEVIIFDEATSSLDNKTELLIMESIFEMMGHKTIVVVAHRLATVKKCDNIFLIDKGVIIDQGRYSDLSMRNAGFFNEIQQKDKE